MPICQPCRMPHNAAVCEDTLAGRTGTARSCFCQHKPYSSAKSRQSAVAEEVPPGPECDAADIGIHITSVGVGEDTTHRQGQSRANTVRSSTFSRAAVGQGQWGRRG